jgi:thioredoxin-dependent peroxiredoxin
LEAKNAVVLGVSPNTPAELRKWIDEESLEFTLLSDPEHKVIEEWGAWGEKSMYGKTYMGVVRSHWIIDEDGTVLDEQLAISPKDSVKKAVDFLNG